MTAGGPAAIGPAMGRSRLVTTAPKKIAMSATRATNRAKRCNKGESVFISNVFQPACRSDANRDQANSRYNPHGDGAPQCQHHTSGQGDRRVAAWPGHAVRSAPYHRITVEIIPER